jgi:uncharacterized protein YegL
MDGCERMGNTTYDTDLYMKTNDELRLHMNEPFEYIYVTRHTNHSIMDDFKMPRIQIPDEYDFGILELKLAKLEPIRFPIAFIFCIDSSGSMSLKTQQYSLNSRIDLVVQVFTKMLKYIIDKNITFYIQVSKFDETVTEMIPLTLLTTEVYETMIDKVRAIIPDNQTNIECAIDNVNDTIYKIRQELSDDTKIVSMILTDGDANTGNTCESELADRIYKNIEHIWIGFGTDHNSKLLKKCTQSKYGKYIFIDDFEKTGEIIGEVLHRIIFPVAIHIHICPNKEGLIYDVKQNLWVSDLVEVSYIRGEKCTYHMIVPGANDFGGIISCNVSYKENDEYKIIYNETIFDELPVLINENGNVEVIDLYPHLFQQGTLELLAKNVISQESGEYENTQNMKSELKAFYKNMKKYMTIREKLQDPFMKILCDDIITTYRTMNTDYSHMYSASRQQQHANRMSYRTCSNTVDNRLCRSSYLSGIHNNVDLGYLDNNSEEEGEINEHMVIPPPPILKRSRAIHMIREFDDISDDDLEDRNYKFTLDAELYESMELNETLKSLSTR